MEQPSGYIAQGETKVCRLKKAIYGLKQSPRAWFENFSLTISGIDFRRCHSDHSIFIRYTRSGIVILTVYVDDILLTGSDSVGMEANVNLWFDDSHTLDDPERYRRLIEKLIYRTVTRPDITFTAGVLSRFMHHPRKAHWLATMRILAYIKSCPRKGLVYRKHGHVHISGYSDSGMQVIEGIESTTGYCTFVGGNLVI